MLLNRVLFIKFRVLFFIIVLWSFFQIYVLYFSVIVLEPSRKPWRPFARTTHSIVDSSKEENCCPSSSQSQPVQSNCQVRPMSSVVAFISSISAAPNWHIRLGHPTESVVE